MFIYYCSFMWKWSLKCRVWVVCVYCRQSARVFSSRTPVTPPSSDCSIHPLSDDETVRFIAEGTFITTEFKTGCLNSIKVIDLFLARIESLGHIYYMFWWMIMSCLQFTCLNWELCIFGNVNIDRFHMCWHMTGGRRWIQILHDLNSSYQGS